MPIRTEYDSLLLITIEVWSFRQIEEQSIRLLFPIPFDDMHLGGGACVQSE